MTLWEANPTPRPGMQDGLHETARTEEHAEMPASGTLTRSLMPNERASGVLDADRWFARGAGHGPDN